MVVGCFGLIPMPRNGDMGIVGYVVMTRGVGGIFGLVCVVDRLRLKQMLNLQRLWRIKRHARAFEALHRECTTRQVAADDKVAVRREIAARKQ